MLSFYLSFANTFKLDLVEHFSFSKVNSLPHMPILGSFNSAGNMISKIWTNGDTIT